MRAVPAGDPLQAWYSWSEVLAAVVRRLSAGADVVHVEHLRGARYGLAHAAGTLAAPVVWDSVDCITHLFEQAAQRRTDGIGRVINRFEVTRTARFEREALSRAAHVLVTSEVDRRALLGLARDTAAPQAPVTVLTNGVDLDYFVPGAGPRDADTLVFSGKMSYHANESAVLHLLQAIMPRVWQQRPATKLVVVGKDPGAALQRAVAAQSGRVTLTGTVADLRPYLQGAAAAVVPLVYGAGCQNKVLEAMASATPVVAMPQAVSALQAREGRDVLVAAGAEPFADAVLGLLGDAGRRREVGEAGRRYVESHHRWTNIAAQLESIYRDVAADAAAGRRLRTA
jgi:glycosyltransferase involved in cell wall biosynthesis